jgi:hypothetical protein
MHVDYLPSFCFWVTSDRDDRALQRLVRRIQFATIPVRKQHWLANRRLSTRTVRNRLKSAGLKSTIALKDIPVVCMSIICHLFASDIRLRTMLTENE